MSDRLETTEELARRLAEPFPAEVISWKARHVSGNRAFAVCYLQARDVMDRLDQVVGAANWQDRYADVGGGNVVCTLALRLGEGEGEWIEKSDVGSGKDAKSAYSDALKRAAVKWGVGRYLARVRGDWVDYDATKKVLLKVPALPGWALPAAAPAASSRKERAAHALPATGAELEERLRAYDARLTAEGLCAPGALLQAVREAGRHEGYTGPLAGWSGAAIALAVEETKVFEARLRKARPR